MKKIICLAIAVLTVFIACSCSCIRGNNKYDYDDLTKYIKLPNYKSQEYSLEEDALKQAIGTYLMQYSSEYTVKRGDKISVNLEFYEVKDPTVDTKGAKITDICKNDFWIENVATPKDGGDYEISYQIENAMIGLKIGATIGKKYTLADDFFVEEYRGKDVFVDIKINNKEAERGDVLMASYVGYYIDDEGNIVKENDKDKTFDQSDSSAFYIGSHLAIEEFENGLIGMCVGVEKDIYATFPDDYEPEPELAGKRVMFRVKIKTVYTPPVYNDAFVTTYFTGFSNIKEFEDALKKEYTISLVYDYISNNAQVIEYPKAEYKAADKQLEEISGTFAEKMSMTLDSYIQQTYGMTRDAYIKSNMKTEMIFYSLRNMIGDSVIPTDEEMVAARDLLIDEYKNEYMQNDGLTESAAISSAKEMVDALGESYVYEQVLYEKIDDVIPSLVTVNMIPAVHSDYVFDAKTE